ncbi:Large-conductance mechanosensitive channel [Dehalococcoides mccartyi]|nr:Large-conductance mechanosensitive channel [Dehalococcoides mccartyi]
MPPIGLLLGNVDFGNLFIVLKEGAIGGPYESLLVAQTAGAVTINYGVFINALINFLILAMAIFFFVVRPLNQLAARQKSKEAVIPAQTDKKDCPYCATQIPLKASKCPYCTSELM